MGWRVRLPRQNLYLPMRGSGNVNRRATGLDLLRRLDGCIVKHEALAEKRLKAACDWNGRNKDWRAVGVGDDCPDIGLEEARRQQERVVPHHFDFAR